MEGGGGGGVVVVGHDIITPAVNAAQAFSFQDAIGSFNDFGGDGSPLNFVMNSLGQSFTAAFIASLCIIIVSELGDKTFFIAALMSMKHSHVVVFAGAIMALSFMTILSTAVGYALPSLLSPTYTHYASIILFLFFGIRMLFDGFRMTSKEGNGELAEVEAELNKKIDHEVSNQQQEGSSDPEDNFGDFSPMPKFNLDESQHPSSLTNNNNNKKKNNNNNNKVIVKSTTGLFYDLMSMAKRSLNMIMLQAFTLTFLAEWGDRSQIATIALAASKDPFGVTIGALLGHSLCTGLAVIGGKILASSISERAVTVSGGVLFLIFGVAGIFF